MKCPECGGSGRSGENRLHRPGPWFQARCLGLWPDSGSGVWSDALWEACLKPRILTLDPRVMPQLGLDCAMGKGEDYHGLYGRWRDFCLLGETANTMDGKAIFRRVKAACQQLADLVNSRLHPAAAKVKPQAIPVKIDDDGVGRTILSFLRAEGYQALPVGAGTRASNSGPGGYPRKRDELWFQVADRAKEGRIYLLPAGKVPGFGLDRPTLRRLKQQLMAPEWRLDGQGRRQVEPKDDTKEKIGRSPDDADAFNLAYYEPPPEVPEAVEPQRQGPRGGRPYWQRG